MGECVVWKNISGLRPSTEEVIAQVAAADAADVDRAVKSASAAFDSGPWPQTTAQDRGRILFKLAEKIRQNAAALAELECRNTGKPIVEAEYDITDVATCFEYYGGLANKVTGHVNPVPANALSFTMREAGWCRRPNHSVELPVADGRVEAGSRDRRGLLLRAEARGADSAHRAGIRQLF